MAADGLMVEALASSDLLIGLGSRTRSRSTRPGTRNWPSSGCSTHRTQGGAGGPARHQPWSTTPPFLDAVASEPPRRHKWEQAVCRCAAPARAILAGVAPTRTEENPPANDVAGRSHSRPLGGRAGIDHRHHRRRFAQISVRAVLAEPPPRHVLDVKRAVGDGLWPECGDWRKAGAPGCSGACGRRPTAASR